MRGLYGESTIYPYNGYDYLTGLETFTSKVTFPFNTAYQLPRKCDRNRFCVIANFTPTTVAQYISTGNNDRLNSYTGTEIAHNRYAGYEKESKFITDTAVLDYTTVPFTSAIAASSTGNCYEIVLRAWDNGGKYIFAYVANRIGGYKEIRDSISADAVVINKVDCYENQGDGARINIGSRTASNTPSWDYMAVCRTKGRVAYNADGTLNETSALNNTNGVGIQLTTAIPWIGSPTGGAQSGNFLQIENARRSGARVLLFDTAAQDKSGQRATFGRVVAIYNSVDDMSKGIADTTGAVFTINDPNAAANTPISELPNVPGVPTNETTDPTGGALDPDKPDGRPNPSDKSDPIDDPSNPAIKPMSAGNRIFAMTANELEQTFNFLWEGKNKDILGVTVSEVDITRALTTAFYLPFDIVTVDPVHTRQSNVTAAGYSSEIISREITDGYNARVNIGELAVTPYYGSFLDFAPYTAINIYLPYIGYRQLNTAIVMGKTIGVDYAFDMAQGACTAYIYFYDENGHKNIFTMFSGQMGIPIKITGTDDTNVEQAQNNAIFSVAKFIGAAGLALATPATGGLSLMGAVALGTSAIGDTITAENTEAQIVDMGTAGEESALTAPQGVYLFIERPRTSTATDFVNFRGWATNYSATVSEFTGFLSCSSIKNTVPCTDTEKAMINDLLTRGIYI